MTCPTVRLLSVGLFALLAACSGSGTSATVDPLCGRQRDNEQRCNPSQSACQRQADYDSCVATKSLYRPELTTTYLSCYPATLGCDSAAQSTAQTCSEAAANQVPVTAALMLLANNICQRCPGIAKDQVTDPMVCATNLTTNAGDLARALHYYTDESLGRLNSCLIAASPPADGCIAFASCFQTLTPVPAASSCADGGALK